MKNKKPTILWQLFLSFLKIGAFTFGGGYVMLAMIRDEFCDKKGWVTDDELLKVYAVAESTPGPVAINASTYIGYKMGGLLGSCIATLATVLPAFTIISVIAYFFDGLMEYKIVRDAFFGIKIGVSVLILKAGLGMLKKSEKTVFSVAATVMSFVLMILIDLFAINLPSVLIIFLFGLYSLSFFVYKDNKNKKNAKEEEENK